MASSKLWEGSIEAKIVGSLEEVWKIITDYYREEHKWFPGTKSAERVEGKPDNGVGAVRRCITSMPSMPNDSFLLEELTAQDDAKHSYTILTIDTDFPGYVGYEATFALFETGEHGNCLFKWSYKMNAIEGRSKEETEGLMNYFLAGIVNNLEKLASSQ